MTSVTKKLFLAKPYGHDVYIKKIECMNHLLQNYINQIVDIVTRQRSSLETVVPGIFRKILNGKRFKLKCCLINYTIINTF